MRKNVCAELLECTVFLLSWKMDPQTVSDPKTDFSRFTNKGIANCVHRLTENEVSFITLQYFLTRAFSNLMIVGI